MPYFPPPETIGEDYDPGTDTLATERFVQQLDRLKVSGAGRLSMEGTARAIVFDFGEPPNYIGIPKTVPLTFTVRNGYLHRQPYRLNLLGTGRANLEGDADLIIDDEVSSRSRIVLAGRG